jgi:hypothetical protein
MIQLLRQIKIIKPALFTHEKHLVILMLDTC